MEHHCPYHPRSPVSAHCSKCGAAMCGACNVAAPNAPPLCGSCEAQVSEVLSQEQLTERRQAQEEAASAESTQQSDKKILIQYAIMFFAVLFIPFRIFYSNLQTPVIETDPGDTEDLLDQCILDLFNVLDILQAGEMPAPNMTCTGSNQTFIITQTAGDVIVSVPNPELYGYSEMSVSRNNPAPRIIE